MTRLIRLILAVVVAAALATGILAQPILAVSTPATLTGEFLSATSVSGTIVEECTNPPHQSAGTVTFSVSGDANGPYSGTFTESGTATIGQPPDDPDLTLTAEFEIISGSTVIAGTKSYEGPTTGETPVCDADSGAFLVINSVDPIQYDAVIDTPEGSFRDQGVSRQFAIHECGTLTTPPCQEEFFGQNFESSLLEPAKCKKDKEGKESDRCKNPKK